MKNFLEYKTGTSMTQLQQHKGASVNLRRDSSATLHVAGIFINVSDELNASRTSQMFPKISLKPIFATIAALYLGTLTNPVMAGERESLEQLRSTTVNLVNLLVQEGVLSKVKADELLQQATQDAVKAKEKDAVADAVSAAADEKMVRIQYVPESVKKEMRDEIKKDVMAKLNYKAGERLGLPAWLDRFEFEGDIRLRYQKDQFPTGNPTPFDFNAFNGTSLTNTTEDQNRLRLRARLGAKVKVNDWLTGGIRMTTGGLDDPISPNQTQGASAAKYKVGLDRAYLNAEVTPWLNVVGGRFSNPWFSTDLVWDPDLAFDGFATSFTPKLNDSWSSFVTLGAFPLDQTEVNSSIGSASNKAKSKWMYGSQAGIKWTSANLSSVKIGVALYDFNNVEGIPNNNNNVSVTSYDGTSPAFRTKGNSYFDINNTITGSTPKYGLASKFRELNITGQIDLATFNPVHIILTGDYVRNIGFDSQEIASRTGPQSSYTGGIGKQVNAYQLKLAIGMPNTYKAGDWQAFAGYKRLEADAVLDSYTDSDFYLGGTNAKGWIVGASYGLDKNAWLTARWFSADEISPRGLSQSGVALAPLAIDVLMLDLNSKF